jgi:tRNA A37 threonylcarbamoyladenosine biosynthesis protein TsaE
LGDVFGREGVALVEWFDRLGSHAPPDCLVVSLALTGETSRRVEMVGQGPRSRAILERAA